MDVADGRVVFEYVGDTAGIDRANNEALGKMQALGTKMMTAIGYAAIAKAAIDTVQAVVQIGSGFESAFAGVLKTVDGTKEQLAGLRTGILDMSKELPASANEIAGVAEAAGQLGIQTENVLGFTKSMIDLGESTNLSANEAATALARFANIMQMPQTEFSKLGSVIVDLGNNFATTEAEIVAMSLRIAGAGKQANMTEADIMGIATSLSSLGIEAEAGGTAISKVITDINVAVQTGSAELDNYAYVAGMSASQFKAAFEEDAAGALAMFIEGLGTMDERGGSAILTLQDMGIEEIRMRDALLRSAGAQDLMTEAIQTGNEAWDENKALTEEAAKRYETLESRADMLKNRIEGIATTFYDDMMPALSDALDNFNKLFDTLEKNHSIENLATSVGSLVESLSVLTGILDVDIPMGLTNISLNLAFVADVLSVVVGLTGAWVELLKWIFTFGQSEISGKYAELLTKPFTKNGSIISVMRNSLDVNRPGSGVVDAGNIALGIPENNKQDSELTDEEWYRRYFDGDYQQGGYQSSSNSGGMGFDDFWDWWRDAPENPSNRNARGTLFWRGGRTLVGEEGPEVVDLPTGAKIYPADVSARMMSVPSINNASNQMIGTLNVYPDSAEYGRILALVESAARARQNDRAGGR